MEPTASISDPFAALDDATVLRMERAAWYENARAWSAYHAAARLAPTSDGSNAYFVSQFAHDDAWSAHHYWARLHDERLARGLVARS